MINQTQQIKEKTYVIKDNQNNYVGTNSISYDQKIGKYYYLYSPFLVNGFYTYPNELMAQEDLRRLQELANKIGFDMEFKIEQINMIEIMYFESKLQIPRYPFICVGINKETSNKLAIDKVIVKKEIVEAAS